MHTFENFRNDFTNELAIRIFFRLNDLKSYVFWTNNDIDFFIDWEIIDTVKNMAKESYFLITSHGGVINIGLTNEVSNESVHWFIINICWSSNLLDFSIFHNDDLIAHCKSLFLIVRNIYKGNTELLMHLFKFELHIFSHL